MNISKLKTVLRKALKIAKGDGFKKCFYSLNWEQFHACAAYTAELDGVTVIRSYSTIIGYIKHGVAYEYGKYSRTTSKQFTKICLDRGVDKIVTYSNRGWTA